MIDSYLRSPYQRILDPIARILRLNPTLVTLIGAACGIALIPASPPIAILLLLLSGFCDTLDGTLARLKKMSSPAGTLLDIVSDRLVESAVIIHLYLVDPTRGLFCLLMLASILLCITSFLCVGIFSENRSEKSFHYSPGIMERTEAFAFFIAMIALPSLFVPLSLAFATLVALTALIRVVQFSAIL